MSVLGVALLSPGVAQHVVAVLFPEAGAIGAEDLDAGDPLGAFPQVEMRHDEADRPAMLPRQRLAFPMGGKQRVFACEIGMSN